MMAYNKNMAAELQKIQQKDTESQMAYMYLFFNGLHVLHLFSLSQIPTNLDKIVYLGDIFRRTET